MGKEGERAGIEERGGGRGRGKEDETTENSTFPNQSADCATVWPIRSPWWVTAVLALSLALEPIPLLWSMQNPLTNAPFWPTG